jgi:hypothetical protein
MGASDSPEQQPPGGLSTPELVGFVLAPPTLVTALAFYMGWKLTEARALYFEIDPSALGFSTQDYLLRSTDALFAPLGAILVLALVAARALVLTRRALADPDASRRERMRMLARGAVVVGALLFVFGALALFDLLWFTPPDLVQSASSGVGIALLAYGVYVGDRLGERTSGRFELVLVGLLVVLSAFWSVSDYADAQGRRRARELAMHLDSRPRVIVFAPHRLDLPGSVTERPIEAGDAAYRYRYSGLRLLVRSDGRYFMVPDRWQKGDGRAIVLADSPSLRFEFGAGQ